MKWKQRIMLGVAGLASVCGIVFTAANYRDAFHMTAMTKQEQSEDTLGTDHKLIGSSTVHQVAQQTMAPQETKIPEVLSHPEVTEKPKMTAHPETTRKPEKGDTTQVTTDSSKEKYLVVIDAGHQSKGDSSLEPIGPGATEKKKKVSSGTQGRFTNVPEYQVNLEVAKQLEEKLCAQGYQVIMVRDTNDVNISNSERAEIANDHDADIFIRLHCNGSENASVNGILTICPTKKNPYCSDIYQDSRLLSDCILEEMVECTGANSRGVTETDTMSGINWSLVPVTIVEMGYMTNREEDHKLVSKDYQEQLVEGMVQGVVNYFASRE